MPSVDFSTVSGSIKSDVCVNQTLLDAKISFIRTALLELENFKSEKYNELLSAVEKVVNSRDGSVTSVAKCEWIIALTQTMDFQSAESVTLITTALKIRWFLDTDSLKAAFFKFVESVVCVKTFFLGQVLESLVRLIAWNNVREQVELSLTSRNAVVSKDSVFGTAELVCSDVFALLKRILTVAPASSSILLQKIFLHFPYKRESSFAHLWYYQNALRVIQYAPMLREAIIEAIVGRIIKLDIQIQHLESVAGSASDSESGSESAEQRPNADHAPANEMTLADSDDEGVGSIFVKPFNSVEDVEQLRGLLDRSLKLLFQYVKSKYACGDRSESDTLFRELLSAFEKVILPSQNYRYTQYLLFYACNLKGSHYPNTFISHLMSSMIDLSKPQIFRYRASIYIGGFVARFDSLPHEAVRGSYRMLLRWALQYLEEISRSLGARRRGGFSEALSRSTPELQAGQRRQALPKRKAEHLVPNFKQHSNFYGVAQSLMYIALFRWRELALTEAEKQEMEQSSLSKWSFSEREPVRKALSEDDSYYSTDASSDSSQSPEDSASGIGGNVRRVVASSKNSMHQFFSHDIDPLRTIMTSKLRPLWVCKASVVQEFCRVMHELQMLYLFHHTPFHYTVFSDSKASPAFAQLDYLDYSYSLPSRLDIDVEDSFFPFEPFDLPETAPFLKDLYKQYESPTSAMGADVGRHDSRVKSRDAGEARGTAFLASAAVCSPKAAVSFSRHAETNCNGSVASSSSSASELGTSTSEEEQGAEGPLKDMVRILTSRAS